MPSAAITHSMRSRCAWFTRVIAVRIRMIGNGRLPVASCTARIPSQSRSNDPFTFPRAACDGSSQPSSETCRTGSSARTSASAFSLSLNPFIVTLQVASGVLENGWVKVEWWYGGSLSGLEAGTLGTSTNIITSPRLEADTAGSSGNNYANRLSTLFYPPTSGNYIFFDSSDDQSDLFVSTDSTPGN